MSINFITEKPIPFYKIKKFNHQGVRVDKIHRRRDVTLTDGTNFIWAIPFKRYVLFTSYGANDCEKLLLPVIDFFGVAIYSEYNDEYEAIIKEVKRKERARKKRLKQRKLLDSKS